MQIPTKLDEFRAPLWLQELRERTGRIPLKDLAAYVDPSSVLTEDPKVLNLSKWYRYESGKSVPSPALVDQTSRKVKGLKFRVHHPVFSCLRHTELSESHRRRLRAQMPAHWHQALRSLQKADARRLPLARSLIAQANLGRLDLLDALFLFFELLTSARKERDHDREVSVITVLYVLPLIYCDDITIRLANEAKPRGAHEFLEEFLLALDEGLTLREGAGMKIQFPAFERSVAVALMYRWVREFGSDSAYRRRADVRRCYLAQVFELQRRVPRAFGLVPCRPPGQDDTIGSAAFFPPVDERIWAWAWHTRAKRYSHWEAHQDEINSIWDQLGQLGKRLKW